MIDKQFPNQRSSSSSTDDLSLPNSKSTAIRHSDNSIDSLRKSINNQSEFLHESLGTKIDKLIKDVDSLLEIKKGFDALNHSWAKLVIGILISGTLYLAHCYLNQQILSPIEQLQESENQQSKNMTELKSDISFLKGAFSTIYNIPEETKKP